MPDDSSYYIRYKFHREIDRLNPVFSAILAFVGSVTYD